MKNFELLVEHNLEETEVATRLKKLLRTFIDKFNSNPKNIRKITSFDEEMKMNGADFRFRLLTFLMDIKIETDPQFMEIKAKCLFGYFSGLYRRVIF
ncbi:MAG: hypothetical protein V4504_01785 [Patescibacteria group bacterium]